MLHESATCKLVHRLARINNVNIAIAGGYPRDLALGRTPKDLDIVAWGCSFGNWEQFVVDLSSANVIISEYAGNPPSAQGDSRVEHVLKITNDIDIILWKEEYNTLQSVVDNFDFNINQWVMTDFGGGLLLPDYLGIHKDIGTLKQLMLCDFHVDQLRIDKMLNLAKELNWSIEQCQTKTSQPSLPTPLPAKK